MTTKRPSLPRALRRSSHPAARVAVAGSKGDEPPLTSPLLPHEHDESPETTPGAREKVMKRAHRDLAEGRVDTEARSNAVRHFERAERRHPAPAPAVRVRRGRKDETT
jgi:hypothetical protein